MTVAQLRAELESREQPTDGKKAALVARLEAARCTSRPASAAANNSPPATAAPPPTVVDDTSAAVDVAMPMEEEGGAEEEVAVDEAPKKKRMSIDASQLALPVLQGKLRLVLGQKAKLPKNKKDLLALYMQHCEHV